MIISSQLHLAGNTSTNKAADESGYNSDPAGYNAEESVNPQFDEFNQCRSAVLYQIAFVTNKLIKLLESRFNADDKAIQAGLDFLNNYLHSIDSYLASNQEYLSNQTTPKLAAPETALFRLTKRLDLCLIEIQMVILAGMAHEHEGFANLFYSLHPNQQSYPTPALLANLICHVEQSPSPSQNPSKNQNLLQRQALATVLNESILFDMELLELDGETPIFTRSIIIKANRWHALNSGNSTLLRQAPITIEPCFLGLHDWQQQSAVKHAKQCVNKQLYSQIFIHSSDNNIGLNRGLALLVNSPFSGLPVHLNENVSQSDINALACQCVFNNAIPILLIDNQQQIKSDYFASLHKICPCVMICSTANPDIADFAGIKVDLAIGRIAHLDAQDMWQELLPEFADSAAKLASWFPLDPYYAKQRVITWQSLQLAGQAPQSLTEVISLFKQYSGAVLPQGIKRVSPRLGWSDLVLPEAKLQQLSDAIDRLTLQHQVLEQWQFLHNRRGAKGVRLLFSGVPGTGKTLSAEVLANELQVDLLIVDLAAVVSKWVGETEKNLAKVFSFAEQSQAVLLFDEADAIFGRRTEVNDSHDRYANLETAYLLTRLEAYEGMTILATNFRNNIDVAFIRRLDFIVDFREPNVTDRALLWRCHVPKSAPINPDVNFTQLATLFPLVGGEIRNAAVAAAYYAAQQQQDIQQEHFIMAIRKEFEKTGKAFREVNPS